MFKRGVFSRLAGRSPDPDKRLPHQDQTYTNFPEKTVKNLASSRASTPPLPTPPSPPAQEPHGIFSRRTRKKKSGYFSTNGSAAAAASKTDAALDKMFDAIRNPSLDEKDSIGVVSLMEYLSSLDVNAEKGEIFVVLEIVQAQSLGVTRQGFIEGWRTTGATASPAAHKAQVRACIAALSADPAYFRRVYRHAFVAGKEDNQKALGLDNAIVYWDMLFVAPGRPWRSSTHDWLALWKKFLSEKWTRSVNRDMWNMTLEFANKTMEEDGLDFWSEDGAWPGVVDDFVQWCRDTGAVANGPAAPGSKGTGGGGDMDIDG